MDDVVSVTIEKLPGDGVAAEVEALGALLHACVMAGASVGFVAPFTVTEAEEFWRTVIAPRAAAGAATVFVARAGGALVGTVQLGRGTIQDDIFVLVQEP